MSEKWKGAPFIKIIQQQLECPVEITKSPLSSETVASTSQSQNQATTTSNPIDLELPGGLSILILTDTDYAGGSTIYRRRLVRFYRAKNSPGSK